MIQASQAHAVDHWMLSGPKAHRNLPSTVTSFIGREQERADVCKLLERTSHLSLVGVGGMGKTRLAAAVAAEWPGPVTFVDLAPLRDAARLPDTVLDALGVVNRREQSSVARIAGFLQTGANLLVLDNCEHLVAACAHLTSALLATCPALRVLTTSREVLGVPGEVIWRVQPLAFPESNAESHPDHLTDFAAVRLFIERALLVQPGLGLDTSDLRVVARIAQHLEGIPLAIELAAARLRVLGLRELEARMTGGLRLLGAGSRLAPERQQTLRATFDWSHALLSLPERALFRRLSVFAGGCTLEAVEAVCSGQEVDKDAVLDLLTGLVDKSLVQAGADRAEGRLRLLEPVREYAAEQLASAGETTLLRARHRDYYVDLSERAFIELWGPEQIAWQRRITQELDNIRAAVAWSWEDPDGADAELRIAGALGNFWFVHGTEIENKRWLDHALARCGRRTTAAWARAKTWEAQVVCMSGEPRPGRALAEDAVDIARAAGAGSSGVGLGNGKAAAILFAREGASVLCVDEQIERAEETCALIGDEKGKASTFAADVTRRSDCAALVGAAVERYGRLDILHNNVGIAGSHGVRDITEEEWDHVMEVNLKSMVLTTQAAVPHLEAAGGGSIINVSSVAALRVHPPALMAYQASKAGVVGLTLSLAGQLADQRIRVNCIAPGQVYTPMVAGLLRAEGREQRRLSGLIQDEGTAWDVAWAAVYLASDESRWVTAQVFVVDAGITATMRGGGAQALFR